MANELQETGGQDASLPVVVDSRGRKLLYFSATAIPTTILLDIMSSGQLGASAIVGIVIGGTVYYFEDEIHRAIGPVVRVIGDMLAYFNRNNSGKTTHKLLNKDWWLGEDTTLYGEEEDELPPAPEPESTGQDEQAARIPQSPAFREMCHLITKERLVLCWSVDGPVYGTVTDLLSMVIVGLPGRGKTTALTYYVAMLLKAGAEVHVWDPHSSLNELVGVEGLRYTDDLADMSASVPGLFAELEERRQLWKTKRQVKRPLLLLVDELPVIGRYASKKNKDIIELIEKFTLEARKWNCYFIGSGQSTDAEILPTRITENLSSRILFFCSDRRARMAGLTDEKAIKTLLPQLKPDDVKGKMIFDCARIGEPILGAIPFTSVSDVSQFVNMGNASGNTVETVPQAPARDTEKEPFPVSTRNPETEKLSVPDLISGDLTETIRRMKESKFSDRDIAKLVGLTGRRYKTYQQVLIQLGYKEVEE